MTQIVIWFEWMGRSADEIPPEYDLPLTDVYAALAYWVFMHIAPKGYTPEENYVAGGSLSDILDASL